MRGKTEEDEQARRQQLDQTLAMPFIEKPEDVAEAVWQALENGESDRVMGSAKLMNGMNAAFPKLTQWAIRTIFQNKDKSA